MISLTQMKRSVFIEFNKSHLSQKHFQSVILLLHFVSQLVLLAEAHVVDVSVVKTDGDCRACGVLALVLILILFD